MQVQLGQRLVRTVVTPAAAAAVGREIGVAAHTPRPNIVAPNPPVTVFPGTPITAAPITTAVPILGRPFTMAPPAGPTPPGPIPPGPQQPGPNPPGPPGPGPTAIPPQPPIDLDDELDNYYKQRKALEDECDKAKKIKREEVSKQTKLEKEKAGYEKSVFGKVPKGERPTLASVKEKNSLTSWSEINQYGTTPAGIGSFVAGAATYLGEASVVELLTFSTMAPATGGLVVGGALIYFGVYYYLGPGLYTKYCVRQLEATEENLAKVEVEIDNIQELIDEKTGEIKELKGIMKDFIERRMKTMQTSMEKKMEEKLGEKLASADLASKKKEKVLTNQIEELQKNHTASNEKEMNLTNEIAALNQSQEESKLKATEREEHLKSEIAELKKIQQESQATMVSQFNELKKMMMTMALQQQPSSASSSLSSASSTTVTAPIIPPFMATHGVHARVIVEDVTEEDPFASGPDEEPYHNAPLTDPYFYGSSSRPTPQS